MAVHRPLKLMFLLLPFRCTLFMNGAYATDFSVFKDLQHLDNWCFTWHVPK